MVADDPFADIEAPTLKPVNDDVPPDWLNEAPPYGEAYDNKPREPLSLIDPAAWQGIEAPHRAWKVKDHIPDGQATLLTGKGAAGKSLVSQLKCTCIAAGLPFLGLETEQANALYLTCEDDAAELHRRQAAICDGLGITLESLSGKLFLLSLQGEMGNELATFDREGRMTIAPRYEDILAACMANEIHYATLDNTAHLFTGNENDRHQVASFINLCNRFAIAIDGAVVIVGHPNKAGDSYSGSTAWENQVRSRLFMEIPVGEDGAVADPDLRVLRREKTNYAQRGGELQFIWHKGSFVLPGDVPERRTYDIAETAQASIENEIFLACLAKATSVKRCVSHINGINYAPRIFAHMPQSKGVKEQALRAAMERLISIGKIELEANLWKGPNRHWKTGIKVVGDCANPPEKMAENRAPTPGANPCADPRQPPSQVIENIAPTLRCADPLYTTYINGAPPEGAAPTEEEPDAWRRNPLFNTERD